MAKEIRNILVVDDSEDDLESVERLVKKIDDADYQYIVVTAHNSEQALHIQKHIPLHCAFVDYFMLTHDGLEVIQLLHEHAKTSKANKELPVALVSGGWSRIEPKTLSRLSDIKCIAKDDMRSSQDVLRHIHTIAS